MEQAATTTKGPPGHGKKVWGPRKLITRGALLVVTAVSLYLLAPSLIGIFSSWRELGTLKPGWIALAIFFEAACFVALWEVQRVALREPGWFAVGTSQLVGNAVGRIVPVGAAAASAAQYRMLIATGVSGAGVASGLAASVAVTTATMFALPVLALPAILGGTVTSKGLLATAYAGAVGFVVTVVVCAGAILWDRPLLQLGRAGRAAGSWVGKTESVADLPERLLAQRDSIRAALGARWHVALAAAVGNWGFEYLALLMCLWAVGAHPSPAVVLLVFVATCLLGLIPLTPGGLGFVEVGLTGLLTVSGVGAHAAVVATLAFRLVSFWLPLPFGAGAYWLFRRRYGSIGVVAAAETAEVSVKRSRHSSPL